MQKTLERNWWTRARMPGALRYHALTTGRLLGFVLLVDVGAILISFLLPLVVKSGNYTFAGVSMDYGLWAVLAAVVCCQVANHRTRFLLRFGSSRFAVWLSNVLSLFLYLLVFALATLLVSLLVGLLMAIMAQAGHPGYRLYGLTSGGNAMELVWQSFVNELGNLPRTLWFLLVTISVLYLFGCCLRRNKPATLCVVIGVPLVFATLLLVPAVREAIDAVQSSQGEAMVVAAQWYAALSRVAAFIDKYFDWILSGVGVACLPLSYLTMRGTKQP